MEKLVDKHILFDRDAWSDGQMQSKLWLAKSLEDLLIQKQRPQIPTLWILGGWYGLFGQILLIRDRLDIGRVMSIDIDPQATQRAPVLNNKWVCEGRFESLEMDCDHLDFYELGVSESDVIINTSCEHFASRRWWENIPTDVLIALQSTNMQHATHVNTVTSVEKFRASVPEMKNVLFQDTLKISYPDWCFERYMLIGSK